MRSYCPDIFVHLGSTLGPPGPPKYEKHIFLSYFGFKLKDFLSNCFLIWHVHRMGERIAGKEDRPSLIIEDPPQGPPNSPKYFFFTFWPIYEKLVCKLFPLLYTCLHCGEVCICWHFDDPATPGFYVRAQHDPEHFLLLNILQEKVNNINVWHPLNSFIYILMRALQDLAFSEYLLIHL